MNWDSVKRNKRRGKAQNTTQVLDVAARAFNKGAADVNQALKEHDIQKDDYAELVDYTTSKESAGQLWEAMYEQILLLAHANIVQEQPTKELILQALKEDPTGLRKVPNTSTFYRGKAADIRARTNPNEEALLLVKAQQAFYNMMRGFAPQFMKTAAGKARVKRDIIAADQALGLNGNAQRHKLDTDLLAAGSDDVRARRLKISAIKDILFKHLSDGRDRQFMDEELVSFGRQADTSLQQWIQAHMPRHVTGRGRCRCTTSQHTQHQGESGHGLVPSNIGTGQTDKRRKTRELTAQAKRLGVCRLHPNPTMQTASATCSIRN